MSVISNERMLGIIEQIKEVENMIGIFEKRPVSAASELMIVQFEDLKRDFLKQLLAELLRSQHNISDFEPFLLRATSYLKKFDKKDHLAGELKINLQEVERLMQV